MGEADIRRIAEKHGLGVLKRITTGRSTAHFATFELSGPPEQIGAAWPDVYNAATTDQLRGGFVYRRCSDIDWMPYIGIESVWCAE